MIFLSDSYCKHDRNACKHDMFPNSFPNKDQFFTTSTRKDKIQKQNKTAYSFNLIYFENLSHNIGLSSPFCFVSEFYPRIYFTLFFYKNQRSMLSTPVS